MSSQLFTTIVNGFFGAGLASMGFAILFNIRGKNIWYASFTGAVGGLVYNVCVFYGCNAVLANFYSVLALAAVSELLARALNCTVSTFMACGLIPLVPGGDAYRMMVSFLNGKINQGFDHALTMIGCASMIVLGILSVNVLTRLFIYIRKEIFHDNFRQFIADNLKM